MSLIHDLRNEADLCRSETADDVAALLDSAADTIESLAKMCFNVEFASCDRDGNEHCPWCDADHWTKYEHKPDCPYVTNGIDALLEEETE